MTTPQIEKRLAAFDTALADLLAQGVDEAVIIAALAVITARVPKSDPEHGLSHQETLAAILDANVKAMRDGTVMNMAQAFLGDQ